MAQVVSIEQETIEVLEDVIEALYPEDVLPESESSRNQNTQPALYQSEYERSLAENWAKHQAEKRKRQEEYASTEFTSERANGTLRKCEAVKRSRKAKYKQELSLQHLLCVANEQLQSPPEKNLRKQFY